MTSWSSGSSSLSGGQCRAALGLRPGGFAPRAAATGSMHSVCRLLRISQEEQDAEQNNSPDPLLAPSHSESPRRAREALEEMQPPNGELFGARHVPVPNPTPSPCWEGLSQARCNSGSQPSKRSLRDSPGAGQIWHLEGVPCATSRNLLSSAVPDAATRARGKKQSVHPMPACQGVAPYLESSRRGLQAPQMKHTTHSLKPQSPACTTVSPHACLPAPRQAGWGEECGLYLKLVPCGSGFLFLRNCDF